MVKPNIVSVIIILNHLFDFNVKHFWLPENNFFYCIISFLNSFPLEILTHVKDFFKEISGFLDYNYFMGFPLMDQRFLSGFRFQISNVVLFIYVN